jgi:hypothetical protein
MRAAEPDHAVQIGAERRHEEGESLVWRGCDWVHVGVGVQNLLGGCHAGGPGGEVSARGAGSSQTGGYP